MEREVSAITMLGVTLVALGAVLGIVVFTIFVGNQLRDNIVNDAVDTMEVIKTGQLNSLIYEKNIMPASAAYVLLQENSAAVKSSACGICHNISNCNVAHPDEIDTGRGYCNLCKKNTASGLPGDCLKGHLRDKVSVQVLENNNSTYYVIIHREDCGWFNSNDREGCTCDGGSVDSSVRKVYNEWELTAAVN